MKDKIEAILFAAGRYVEAEQISKLLQSDLRTVKKALSELKEDYAKREGGALLIVQENNAWKIQVKDAFLEYATKLANDTEIAKTTLETLAVVAWKNGISQAELIKIRGPAAYEHIGELVEKGYLTKTPEGRSFKLLLQQKFFDYFDVTGREDMKQLFAPIEAEKAAAQADIDKRQGEYDDRVKAAQKALETGSTQVTVDTVTSAPSAQEAVEVKPADLITESKEAVDKLPKHDASAQAAPPTPTPLPATGTPEVQAEIKAVEEAVKDFGAELKELKKEVSGESHHPTHKEHHKKTKQSSATVIVANTHSQQPKPSQ